MIELDSQFNSNFILNGSYKIESSTHASITSG